MVSRDKPPLPGETCTPADAQRFWREERSSMGKRGPGRRGAGSRKRRAEREDRRRKRPMSSGKARKPGEVGLALLEVGAVALLAFVGHVEEQGGVAREFLQAGLAVAIGIERGLQA